MNKRNQTRLIVFLLRAALTALVFSFSSCKLSGLYITKQGDHIARQEGFKAVQLASKHNLDSVLECIIKLNESVLYTSRNPINQRDWNKLFGVVIEQKKKKPIDAVLIVGRCNIEKRRMVYSPYFNFKGEMFYYENDSTNDVLWTVPFSQIDTTVHIRMHVKERWIEFNGQRVTFPYWYESGSGRVVINWFGGSETWPQPYSQVIKIEVKNHRK